MVYSIMMLKWLFTKLSDTYFTSQLEEVRTDLAQLRTSMNLFQSEIIEEVLARTARLNKRMQTRMSREKPEEEPPVPPTGRKVYGGQSREFMGLRS